MNKSNTNKLIARYPELYRLFMIGRTPGKPYRSCNVYGFEHGDGWYNIIEELSNKISSYIAKLPKDKQEDLYCLQVKEKFGGLRFYMHGYDETIESYIREAEKACDVTCESCGSPGTLKGKSWVRTMCDPCDEKRIAERAARVNNFNK